MKKPPGKGSFILTLLVNLARRLLYRDCHTICWIFTSASISPVW